MPVYSVTYDLNSPGQNYKGLINELESFPSRIHLLKSEWLIGTTQSAQQISDVLLKHTDKGDRLLVIKVTDYKQGWLTQDQWDWINQAFRIYGG
jgi:hypothetical protein